MVQVLNRIQNAKPITIKQIAAETNRIIQEQNAKIISLAQGTPNLPIFQSAHDAMVQLIDTNKLPYTDVQGLLSVRQTASQFINQMFFFNNHDNNNKSDDGHNNNNNNNNNSGDDDHNVVYSPENVIITAGAVQAVYNVLALSIESENDVVVSPLPAYGLYKHQTELLGGTFVPVETHESHQFIPTVDSLRRVFDQYQYQQEQQQQQIKSIVLCYPNNPVGSNLSQQQAKELAEFLDEQLQLTNDGFSIILDEVYFGIVNHNNHNHNNNHNNNNNSNNNNNTSSDQSLSTTSSYRQHVSILQYASTRVLNNSFLILSASKGLGAMPGMRCGFCCCYDQRLVQCMTNIQMACSANASICSQEGLRASLQYIMDHPIQSLIQQVSRSYSERTELVVQRLNQLGRMYGCHVTKETGRELVVARVPSATFYVFVNFSELLPDEFGVKSDEQIQQFFRDMYIHGSRKTGVACVPGVAFGMNPTQKLIRFSCAVEMNDLVEAMDIIQEAVEMILVKRVLLNQ